MVCSTSLTFSSISREKNLIVYSVIVFCTLKLNQINPIPQCFHFGSSKPCALLYFERLTEGFPCLRKSSSRENPYIYVYIQYSKDGSTNIKSLGNCCLAIFLQPPKWIKCKSRDTVHLKHAFTI